MKEFAIPRRKRLEGKWYGRVFVMKRVIFPLLGAIYLGLSHVGSGIIKLLYDEEIKGGVCIEMCRPWERRQGRYPYQNKL